MNRIPLSTATIEQIIARLEPYDYERLYTLNGGIVRHAKQSVRHSADRYIGWIRGGFGSDV